MAHFRRLTCALVKYRVPHTGPYPKSPAALQDAQRAVGMVRSRAAAWQIDPKRIGVLGFSAGAHLAAALGTHFERRLYDTVDAADGVSCRPDFAVLSTGTPRPVRQELRDNRIYPDRPTPPSFILQSQDDPVHVETRWSTHGAEKRPRSAELHIYAAGRLGYGLAGRTAGHAGPERHRLDGAPFRWLP